jgi:hypothetical protein
MKYGWVLNSFLRGGFALDIVLDTNIIRKDFTMKSDNFIILHDYIKRTKSKVILTELVYKEIAAIYEREISKRYNDFLENRDYLGRNILGTTIDDFEIDIKKCVANYLEFLLQTLKLTAKDIVPIKQCYLDDIVERAIHRIPPCSAKGEEFRDVLLWLTLLDVAVESNEKKLIFISENKKQFASCDGTLHPFLLEETKLKGVNIIYYNSMKQFIKDHKVKISYINDEWILGKIDLELVKQEFMDVLWKYGKNSLLSWVECREKKATDYLNLLSSNIWINEFYVYEMKDGSLHIEVILGSEMTMEIEVEIDDKMKHQYYFNWATGGIASPRIITKKW